MPTDSRTALDVATSGKSETPLNPSTNPEPYRFSLEEAYAIGETGIFRGKKVELIGGQFVVKEPPSSFHAAVVRRLNRLLHQRLTPGMIIDVQNPVVLSTYDVPEPDVTVLAPRDDDYASEHPAPEDVFLAVEVSNTSLRYDRSTKASLYAAAGIGAYWIMDINAKVVHVHHDPTPNGYETIRTAERDSILDVPGPVDAVIPVSELFPDEPDSTVA